MVFAKLHIIDWAVVAAYMILVLYIGFKFSKKASKNLEGFFLSGRSIPWWLAGTSVVAGHFSVSFPVKITSLVREYGIQHAWLHWYMIPAAMVGAIFLAKLWRRAKILTSIELLRIRLTGPGMHFLTLWHTLWYGVFMKCFWLGMTFIALEKLIVVMFPDMPESCVKYVIIALCVISLIYAVSAGLYGVVATDFIQFIFAFIGSVTLVILIFHHVGSPTNLVAQVQALPGMEKVTHIVPEVPKSGASLEEILKFADVIVYVLILWMFNGSLIAGGGDPQRIMGTKNERNSMLMLIWSNIIERGITYWLWIVIALGSLVMLKDNPIMLDNNGVVDHQRAYMAMGLEFLPIGLKGIFVASILAALMSTTDTIINSGASFVVNDLYKNYLVKSAPQTHYILVSRITTVVLLGLAFVFWYVALQGTSILNNFKVITALLAGSVITQLVQWFWWRVNAWSLISSMIMSAIVTYILKFYLPANYAWFEAHNLMTTHYPIGILIVVLSTCCVWVPVTLLTQPADMERLKDFYQRVRPIGFWGPVRKELGVTKAEDTLNANSITTWVASVTTIYGVCFGLGSLFLGRYITGVCLFVMAGVALKVMLTSVAKNAWWHREDPDEDETEATEPESTETETPPAS